MVGTGQAALLCDIQTSTTEMFECQTNAWMPDVPAMDLSISSHINELHQFQGQAVDERRESN